MKQIMLKLIERARKRRHRSLKRLGRNRATVRVNRCLMTLDLRDRVISEWLFIRRTWEPFETDLTRGLLRPGATFIDIGAHIGYYSLLAARRVGSRGRVFAFEPAPDNYALLTHNVHQNRLQGTVRTANLALSDEERTLELHLSTFNTGDHRVYPTDRQDDAVFNAGEGRVSVGVKATTLDAWLARHEGGPVDVIKVDVQGAELSVLEGMRRTLATNRNASLFIEYWPHGMKQFGDAPVDLLRFLTEVAEMSLLRIMPDTRRLEVVTAEELASASFAPTLQVDLLCCRDPQAFLGGELRQLA